MSTFLSRTSTEVEAALERIPAHRRLTFLIAFIEANWERAAPHVKDQVSVDGWVVNVETSSLGDVLERLRSSEQAEQFEPFLKRLANQLLHEPLNVPVDQFVRSFSVAPAPASNAPSPGWWPTEADLAPLPEEQEAAVDWSTRPPRIGMTPDIRKRLIQDYFSGKLPSE